MAYEKNYVFTRLGKAVKKYNAVAASPDGIGPKLDLILEEIVGVFNNSDEDRRLLNLFTSSNRTDQAAAEALKNQVVSIVSSFFTNDLAERLGAVGNTSADVLDLLRDAMQDAGDTVLETKPVATLVAYDNDNTGNGTLTGITLDQMCRDFNHFECECVDASTTGEERWRVTSSVLGYVGEAVTGTEFDASEENSAGSVEAGVKFTINQAAGTGAEDWAVGDSIRFSTYSPPRFVDLGDAYSTFSNWKLMGVKLGYNTSANKYLYVTIEQDAGSPATWTVNAYKDSAKTELVASVTAESSSGTVTLEEKNGSGLSIRVDISYTYDDDGIQINFTNYPWFQTFLVERFSRAMPSAPVNSNTVDVALAG